MILNLGSICLTKKNLSVKNILYKMRGENKGERKWDERKWGGR